MAQTPHILIAYDGSDPAKAAVEVAGRLFARGARATVICVWEPPLGYVGTMGVAAAPVPDDQLDEEQRKASGIAAAGARRARAAGLVAESESEEGINSTWRSIVRAAEREQADLIVMGTHGRSVLRSLLIGSTSHNVAQHATTPVLIVPDEHLETARRTVAELDLDKVGRAA